MLILNSEQIVTLASIPRLIEGLREAFRSDCIVPPRQVLKIPADAGERLLLSMPAFDSRGCAVVKLATVIPRNPEDGLPATQATIVAFSEAGTPVALLDGGTITKLRTGAASALASTYLSREDSAHLVLFGTGALAPFMAMAHCAVRHITRISVCGRRAERASETAALIRSRVRSGIDVGVATNIESAVSAADIVSCATSAAVPVLAGKWLRPGTFVDLVGSFSPLNREADDDVVRHARLFVDTFDGALSEAGDFLDPLARGVIQRAQIEGELSGLVRANIAGRTTPQEIIVFKSVGTALEDLAATQMVLAAAQRAETTAGS